MAAFALVTVVMLWVGVWRKRVMGVPPQRGARLLRCASSHLLVADVALLHGGHPSRELAATLRARWRAGWRRTAAFGLAGSLANAAIKAAPSSQGTTAESGRQRRPFHDSGPFPCPGIAGLCSFTLRVNEARLTNWPACRSLRSVRRRPDRHPGHPPRPMPGR